jgi:hypothetical protein
MVSKTAKIIAFFLVLGLITPSGVLAQENPWMITVFNNVSDIPEDSNHDIEFNGITIIRVTRFVFKPENRIEPLDFKDEFTVENVSKRQAEFKDDLRAGRRRSIWGDYYLDENITFKEYPDEMDKKIFFKSFLNRHPFMRLELNPIEVEIWTVNNLAVTGKIRVHATIFKNGFCLISLVYPIVTKELKDKYKLEGDFLVADKPLKPDDVVYITKFRTNEWDISPKAEERTLTNISISRLMYLEHVFFGKGIKPYTWNPVPYFYSWNTSKTVGKGNSTELLKENPWDIDEIMHIGKVYKLKTQIFSTFSEVYATYSSFHIFSDTGYFTHDVYEPMTHDVYALMTHQTQIEEYGYNPSEIRLAEVVFLQEYMLATYNDFVIEKLEELGRKNESEYQNVVKEIALFRKEISIALDEFYLIEDSLRYSDLRYFVRYGKQKRNLDFMHEILRVKMEDLSKISGDMNNVIMQENNAALQQRIVLLTWLGILLALCLFFGNIYSEEFKTKLRKLLEIMATKLRRLLERMAKK